MTIFVPDYYYDYSGDYADESGPPNTFNVTPVQDFKCNEKNLPNKTIEEKDGPCCNGRSYIYQQSNEVFKYISCEKLSVDKFDWKCISI